MSKKRLYEIAKELGKESKEVVARAKELGLDVKSHSSSVEEAVAAKIAASFKPAAAPKVEAKPAAPKVSAEKKAEKSEPAKPAVAKEEAKPAAPKASAEKKAEKSEPVKPAVAKEEAKPAEPVTPKTEKVSRLNRKVVISRLSVKHVLKSRQSDASKIRAITVTNNKTETVRKTTAVMVENKVKATATIVALMTKLRSSKVSKNVEMSAVSKRINVQIKRLHVLTLKPVQQP